MAIDDLGEVACAGGSTWIFDLSEVGQRVTGAFLQIFDLSEVFFMEKFRLYVCRIEVPGVNTQMKIASSEELTLECQNHR